MFHRRGFLLYVQQRKIWPSAGTRVLFLPIIKNITHLNTHKLDAGRVRHSEYRYGTCRPLSGKWYQDREHNRNQWYFIKIPIQYADFGRCAGYTDQSSPSGTDLRIRCFHVRSRSTVHICQNRRHTADYRIRFCKRLVILNEQFGKTTELKGNFFHYCISQYFQFPSVCFIQAVRRIKLTAWKAFMDLRESVQLYITFYDSGCWTRTYKQYYKN